jgi:putative flippase GtrA
MTSQPRGREFAAFLFVAGSAAGLNLVARALYSLVMPFGVAVCVAYATGMIYAFLMYRRFVFGRSGGSVNREIRGFLLVQALSFAQVWVVSMVLLHHVLPAFHISAYRESLSHLLGVLSPVLVSYYGHKLISFRKIGGTAATQPTA